MKWGRNICADSGKLWHKTGRRICKIVGHNFAHAQFAMIWKNENTGSRQFGSNALPARQWSTYGREKIKSARKCSRGIKN